MGLYIGVMSGTSLDGIDVAVVNFNGVNISLQTAETYPFDTSLRQNLLELINSGMSHLQQLGQIDMALGYAYSDAINQLLSKSHIAASDIKAIGCHGQTIYHDPVASFPFSMQIGNAHVIAEKTGINTVADFRQHDMILGGQGAPLVPAFHQSLFRNADCNRVIVNIGGISNITILPAAISDNVTGFDTGPGNVLLDQWYQQHHHDLFDNSGSWAQDGEVDKALLELLMSEPFFLQPAPKSTGREYFNMNWLTQKLSALNRPIRAETVQRTLLQMTAMSISGAIKQYAEQTDEVYICGGGAHNKALMQALTEALPNMTVKTTVDLGLKPDWVEACAFAWLARQFMHQLPGNLPLVTGAQKATILGALYPANKIS